MKNKILITFALIISTFALSPLSASAANPVSSQVQCGVNQAANVSGCAAQPGAGISLNSLLSRIINILSLLVGAVAVVMVIVGGFRYVASAGNDTSTAAAKKTILYALIGLLVAATAQILVHFVLNGVDSASPTYNSTSSAGSGSSGSGSPSSGTHGPQSP